MAVPYTILKTVRTADGFYYLLLAGLMRRRKLLLGRLFLPVTSDTSVFRADNGIIRVDRG